MNKLKVLLLIAIFYSAFSASSTREITYPRPEDGIDKRQDFALEVLQKILSGYQDKYQLTQSDYPAQQDRALLLLNERLLDVVWTGASKHREEHYRAIRIPIQKGLLGWRLFLVNKDNTELLKSVESSQQLRHYSIGLGGGWPDVALFSDNGFVVHTTTSYDALFHMLQKRRFQLFPRSVMEIWGEYDSYKHFEIAVEPHVIVRYPYANFFFVNKQDEALAKDIEAGFNAIIDSGEYEAIFQATYQDILKRSRFSERKIMTLKNGFFREPDDTEKKYYFNL